MWHADGIPDDRTLVQLPALPSEATSSILDDHGEQCLAPEESSRIWSHPALPGIELFQGAYRSYEFAPHFHSVPAIGLVDKGAMRCETRTASHHVPAGEIIMLNPGDVHAPGPVSEGGWSFRVFFLDDALFQAQSMGVSGKVLRFAQPFLNAPRLARTLLTLHRRLEEDRGALEAESELVQVFEQLAEAQGVARPEQSHFPAERKLIRRCREYIDAHFARNISLADLSASAGTSPFHLLRTFREQVGLTPHAYLIQVRIEAAKRLLRSRTAIAEVARVTGFTDQSHLTRHFKRLTGVTPSRYRPWAS